jgi:hypothetical protein
MLALIIRAPPTSVSVRQGHLSESAVTSAVKQMQLPKIAQAAKTAALDTPHHFNL